ncbi:MAG: MBL fold metallo-hydrolase [Candidatus Bipolaricaulia bacterium]
MPALTAIILGSGSPIPYDDRAQSGFLLIGPGDEPKPVLVDCGSGILRRLGQLEAELEFGPQAINEVFLTHHHLDHMADLLPLLKARWLLGRSETNLYGPEGTRALLGALLELYPYLKEALKVNVVELAEGEKLAVGGLEVTALRTVHHIPNLAYKFAGRVVISGDTEPFPKMGEFAEGCPLLIHECSFPEGFTVPGHSTPRALGKALAGRGIETLVLVHFYPPAIVRVAELVESLKAGGFQGRVEAARDLDHFQIE